MERNGSHYQTILHWANIPALPEPPSKPLNMMVLTSIRDVGTCDKNGMTVRTPEGWRYMEGGVERLIYETREGGALHGLVRIAGIINDDREVDMNQSEYPVKPHQDHPWIFPLHSRNAEGELYTSEDYSHYIPSDFRNVNKRREPECQAEQKLIFEEKVIEVMRQRSADILLSDHYMAQIDYLIDQEHGLYGRVLNIHPAITLKNHPYSFRGKFPTRDAIERAQTDPNTITGATLHLINPVIDDGPPIAHTEGTPVYAYDKEQDLRFRNYQRAKLPLLIMGLRHYIENIYPHLDRHTTQISQPAYVSA